MALVNTEIFNNLSKNNNFLAAANKEIYIT